MPHRPSRFDNRPSELLDAKQACARLGVKPATLYTYVSRGLIRRVMGTSRRARLYLAEDVERMRARAEARRGHRAVAVGALRFGEPVLDTSITEAGPERLAYRGQDAVALVEGGARFERVAALLWQADLHACDWPVPQARLLRGQDREAPVLLRLTTLLPRLARADPDRARHAGAKDPARAQRLVRGFAASLGPRPGARPNAESVAQTIVQRLDLEPRARPAIDAALGLVADHELNISTFAARVTASGGADLYACVGAALYAFSGPRHGAAPARVAALVDELGTPRRARDALRARIDRGDPVPGFGHPLYPDGDPRAPPLLEWAQRLAPARCPKLRTLRVAIETMQSLGPHAPTVDVGLLALAYALDRPPEDASAIFCVGRSAGWIAHIFEQRGSQALLRPRARYVPQP